MEGSEWCQQGLVMSWTWEEGGIKDGFVFCLAELGGGQSYSPRNPGEEPDLRRGR